MQHDLRRWKTLCEAENRYTQSDEFYREVVEALGTISVEAPPSRRWVKNRATKLYDSLDGPVVVFRLLGLKELPELHDGMQVGQHWTNRWAALKHYDNFYTPRDSRRYVLHGIITRNAVNLPYTLAYRYLFPEEHELFIDKDATIFLSGISEYPSQEEIVIDNRIVGRDVRVRP